MKKILAAITMLLVTTTASAITLPILGVIDGDTIRTFIPLECPLCDASVRINGIDTPESLTRYAGCAKEVELGLQAKAFTQNLVGKNTTMEVSNVDWDKYGGRILGTVVIKGKDVAQELINAGLAKPYFGSGPKPDWCQ